MRPSRRPIVIATRCSILAQSQANAVAGVLRRLHPKVNVELLPIESEGDQRKVERLSDIGGKGVFTRAIERALLDGEADIAVHSLKDMPTDMTEGLIIAAVPPRGDVRDALVGRGISSIDDLSAGAIVGTSSHRRASQILHLRNDIAVRPIRGNVETRVSKVLDDGEYDAVLLAVAGLERCGLADHVKCVFDTDVMLPAAGQGALAIQCRADDHVTLRRCFALNDSLASEAVHTERLVVSRLGAGHEFPCITHSF